MKKIFVLVVLLCITSVSFAENYFTCTGRTGIADSQSALPLISKKITSSESTVEGSMHITAEGVAIDGIPFVASTYKICQNYDQSLWFSPSEQEHCVKNDQYNDLGVFNKVSGMLRYHAGDFLAVLKCKKASKLMK